MEPDRLRLVVENTGQWVEARKTHSADEYEAGLPGGLGLANVRARLAALGYAAVGPIAPGSPSSGRPDPKDCIAPGSSCRP